MADAGPARCPPQLHLGTSIVSHAGLLVHLDKDDPPTDLVLAVAEVPEDVTTRARSTPRATQELAEAAAPPELTRFGDDFVTAGNSCILIVPSVLAPHENNCLINPAHAEFGRIVVRDLEPLNYENACLKSVLIAHPRSPEYYRETNVISVLQQWNQRCEIQNLRSSYSGQSTFSLLLNSLTFLFTFASSHLLLYVATCRF